MAEAGLGRGLAMPLLLINFCLYLVAACLAGWALNKNFDAANDQGEGTVGNDVTQSAFLPIVLIACMVGLASVLARVHHMRLFKSDSLAATSLIAWLLVLLAMGLACKQIHIGGNRPRRVKVVEAFIIILALFELLHLLALHAASEEWATTAQVLVQQLELELAWVATRRAMTRPCLSTTMMAMWITDTTRTGRSLSGMLPTPPTPLTSN